MVNATNNFNLVIKTWFTYIFSKWKLILMFAIGFAILGYIYASLKKITYKSDLTFVLSNDDNNSLASLTNQFGISLGNSNDAFSGENIINLFMSRKMVQWALFQKIPGRKEKLLDIFIKESGLYEKLLSDNRLKATLPFPDDGSNLSPLQDSILRGIHNSIIKHDLTITRPNTKLSFFKISTVYSNELFSLYFTKYLVDATSKLYIDTKTATARKNLSMLQGEADSVNRLIMGAITATGAANDNIFNLNPAFQVQRSPVYTNQLKATVNQAAYTEILKNLELAKIALLKQSPIYMVIDEPHLPLETIGQGKLTSAVLGFMFGASLAIIWVVVRKFILKIINTPLSK